MDDAAVVKAWLTAIDERKLLDALDLLGDDWVEVGPGGSELHREAFLTSSEATLSEFDLRLAMGQQVATDSYVATSYQWVTESGQVDVLRLDVVLDGKMQSSTYAALGGFG